jgi:glucokinase
MPDTHHIVAIDVGGSSVKSGLVDFDLHITRTTRTPIDSQADADTILNTLRDIIQAHLAQSQHIVGVGFGFPSPFEYDTGVCRIHGVEKFEGIYGLNIGDELRARLNLPNLIIRFRNDAESAIVGEAKFGAGKPYRRLIGVTLGTGMGSSFIVDGKRLSSGKGVPKQEGGFLFPEFYKGERVDDVFSTRGLLGRFDAAGLHFDSVADAKAAADKGDGAVQQIFAAFGADLGQFLTPWVNDFEAEAVLALGGISGAWQHFDRALNDALPVPAKVGILGSDAALLGAAEQFLGVQR